VIYIKIPINVILSVSHIKKENEKKISDPDGIRTHEPRNTSLMHYQLSYGHNGTRPWALMKTVYNNITLFIHAYRAHSVHVNDR